MKKAFRSYNVKTIETPTTVEVWEYIDDSVVYLVSVEDKAPSKYESVSDEQEIGDTDDISACEHYNALKRKQKHYEEMRWVIARIVDCNFDDNTKFMTLTFKENIQDVSHTNYGFSKFIKRLNFHLYHVKRQCLKYLAVWEKQKRGAIHYHIIFFDLPFIQTKKLAEIWGHGFVKINKIDVDSKDNRGRYVSKYFSKNVEEKTYKQKSFFKSQNLIMPITTRSTQYELSDFSNENVVFSKVYSRKVPDFYNPLNIGKEDISFKTSTVRYTRIRKE